MKVIIDITKNDYELIKNGQIPYSILSVFKKSKIVKEAAIEIPSGKYKIYMELEERNDWLNDR